eukprot:CAMPEP_0194415122 /NCGR_PEP_ID=MMETSP0176-20130528/13872_1 /TAXON_ID=216777 /ORGANISM="Proboscia alata, Strain PI-D3" /LENGTH=86 /DNA_ID=CAMNT_0039219567 /DNA_START=146 /DNA_END=403 /DNA_ORIENTATION=-
MNIITTSTHVFTNVVNIRLLSSMSFVNVNVWDMGESWPVVHPSSVDIFLSKSTASLLLFLLTLSTLSSEYEQLEDDEESTSLSSSS